MFKRKKNNSDPSKWMSIAEILYKDKHPIESKWAFRQALNLIPGTLAIEHTLLDYSPKRFLQRRDVGKWLQPRVNSIRQRALANIAAGVEPYQPRVFMYWGQGFEKAPLLVKRCYESMIDIHGDRLVALDDITVHDWVRVPQELQNIPRSGKHHRAHYADYLRTALLFHWGGVWVDATCFVSKPFLGDIDKLMPGGFFAFRYGGVSIANWFLAARPANYIMAAMLEAFGDYRRDGTVEGGYFGYYHIFEALYYLDPMFVKIWDTTANMDARLPNILQKHMTDPYDPEVYKKLMDDNFIHKLCYKKPQPSGSIVEHLISSEKLSVSSQMI